MKLPKPLRFLRNMILFFFISTILTVVVYRFVPVYITPLMVIRSVQQVFKGESPRWLHITGNEGEISRHSNASRTFREGSRYGLYAPALAMASFGDTASYRAGTRLPAEPW